MLCNFPLFLLSHRTLHSRSPDLTFMLIIRLFLWERNAPVSKWLDTIESMLQKQNICPKQSIHRNVSFSIHPKISTFLYRIFHKYKSIVFTSDTIHNPVISSVECQRLKALFFIEIQPSKL